MTVIAITGATGFVGSHLRTALDRRGPRGPPALRSQRGVAGGRVRRRRRHPPRGRARQRPLDGRQARGDPREPPRRHAGRRRRDAPPPSSRRACCCAPAPSGSTATAATPSWTEDAPAGEGFLERGVPRVGGRGGPRRRAGHPVGQPALRHHLRARRRGVSPARAARAARPGRPDGLRSPVVAVGAHRRRRRRRDGGARRRPLRRAGERHGARARTAARPGAHARPRAAPTGGAAGAGGSR